MAATTASILERTAVAAADANNVDLDVIANNLASAARRVRGGRARLRLERAQPLGGVRDLRALLAQLELQRVEIVAMLL